jgi:uncharacterized protein (TIGR02466 family)
MSTQHFNLFSTPVTHAHIGLQDTVSSALYDDWKFDWPKDNLKSDGLKELKLRIDHEVAEYWKLAGWESSELRAFCAQYNELKPGNHLVPHHHAGSLISWCYYVNVPPGAGAISFIDPRGNTSWDLTVKKSPAHTIMPKSGDLIIFPGWVIHYVHPNLSDEVRTTISGDHNFKEIVEIWQPIFNEKDSDYANGFY